MTAGYELFRDAATNLAARRRQSSRMLCRPSDRRVRAPAGHRESHRRSWSRCDGTSPNRVDEQVAAAVAAHVAHRYGRERLGLADHPPQSSSASRFTAGASGFKAPTRRKPAGLVLPAVRLVGTPGSRACNRKTKRVCSPHINLATRI